MRSEPSKVCKPCIFFNGEHCEFLFEHTITEDTCITKIDRYEDRKDVLWTCCGGIKLHQDEKCSICGDGYDE